ncbi:MAG: rhomboid family intramembrane serine protease [Chloroflexota bacterium]|nr:MAG: rhomboid family intramembrane serine protease [Chloroflexota bacterium]TMD87486.1 MAG: rhomboid family intramembrane serine protease [Chloroflexota bacterium]
MLPIRDYNPPRRRALLTWGLILINFGVYFYLAQNPVMDENAIARYAVTPADITAGRHLGTLITSMFLHANLLHVAGNMLFLWIFGNNVEDKLGELRFLTVYFASGIGGSLLQIFITPNSTVPMLGASGAISGLLAAYVLYFPRARILTFVVPFFIFTLPAFLFIGYWIGLQALNAFLNIGAIGGGVAFFAHVGGFGTGLILALLLRPREHPDPHPGYGGYP